MAPKVNVSVLPGKGSFLDKLTNSIYLDHFLKLAGIAMLALGLFECWKQVGIGTRTLMITGPLAWYVGDKFSKLYR